MSQPKVDEEVLIRYLSKETTEDENIDVENWIEESDANREIIEQFYFVLEASDKLSILQSVDTDQALAQFKQTLKNKKNKARRHLLLPILQRVAAVLFLPAITFSLYLYLTPNSSFRRVEQVEMRTHSGMMASCTLPDNTKVWLNSNSYIRYPSVFTGNKRKVEIEGQIYFEVARNIEQPFIVETRDKYSIEVLGTTFNIAAYADEDIIETTLVNGSVMVDAGSNNLHRTLLPNEKAIFSKSANKLEVITIDPQYEVGWRNGQLKFRNHSMEHVLRVLGRQYNVLFDVTDQRVLESKITASFNNEQLPQILHYLQLASDIKFKMQPVKLTNEEVKKTMIKVSR